MACCPLRFRYQHMTEAAPAEVGGELPRCQSVEKAVISVQCPVASKDKLGRLWFYRPLPTGHCFHFCLQTKSLAISPKSPSEVCPN